MCWTVRASKTCRGEYFSTLADRSWGPPSPVFDGWGFYLPEKSGKGLDFEHAPPSRSEVVERVELQFYFSGASRTVLGCILSFTFCPFIYLIYNSR